jgi:outer membrane protein assembly factor BamA
MTVETNFDESAHLANYHIVVEEGKPYQMGEVLIKNASEDEEKRIRGKWQMAQGAVFNLEYVKGFVKKMFDDRNGRTPRVLIQTDRAKGVANVLFTF